jgi:4-azaleucine resistance transporter AzlC
MPEISSNRSLFWAGVRATLPVMTSVAPFGMLVGATGLTAGIPAGVIMAMSPVVFAGSSQLLALQLMASSSPALVLLLTTLVVNLRHTLYGISLAPHVRSLRRGWQWLLAYFMTDEVFAITISRYNQEAAHPPPNRHWFFLGSGLTLWSGWQLSTGIGLVLGSQIPASWGLDFAIALTFIALVVPALADHAAVLAALVGGGLAVLLAGLPYNLGLVAAALGGILAGMAVDLGWISRKSKVSQSGSEELND